MLEEDLFVEIKIWFIDIVDELVKIRCFVILEFDREIVL